MSKLFKVYPLRKYTANQQFIDNCYEEYELHELDEQLTTRDRGYHLRVHKSEKYTFFGDIDEFTLGIDKFIDDMIEFLLNYYTIDVNIEDFKYTNNEFKNGSYHYSVPKLNCTCEKLKEIHGNFKKIHKNEYSKNKMKKACIDTTIYAEHWFRYPLQSKESDKRTLHKIIKGTMTDFIVEYIPHYSKSIEDYPFIFKPEKVKTTKTTIKKDINVNKLDEKNINVNRLDENDVNNQKVDEEKNAAADIKLKKSKYYDKYVKYKQLFDNCYKQERIDDYSFWTSVGMALKNIFDMDAFDLFDYYSSRSTKYEGSETVFYKYKSFKYNYEKGYNIGTIYKYAKEDNLVEYKKIMFIYDVSFGEHDFAKTIYELANDRFLYKKIGNGAYQLYCYNGKYWEADDLLLRKFISIDLYEHYTDLLNTVYIDSPNKKKLKTQIEDLKRLHIKKHIIESYREFGVKNIEFDTKWWLLGFKNLVLDLKIHKFRDYNNDDYISMTTGYDWNNPTENQITTLKDVINKIMPFKDERKLYKQILSTSLEGRCLEKFIVFNGSGRNGKGAIDEFLIESLGQHAMFGNSAILFESSKTGSNPELANMNKKRLVVFKEPTCKRKFDNSIIKELTGGGKISARGHHESETEKILYNTIICECNEKPQLADEPKTAEIERVIDIPFRSTFKENDYEVNETEYIFKADPLIKDHDFRQEHKYALIKILIDAHEKYANNNNKFKIPEVIKQRTNNYLQSGCNLLQWFKDNYKPTNEKGALIKIVDVYDDFKISEYYTNLSKADKRKHNYKYLIEYFSNNILTKKYYKERYGRKNYKNILLGWKLNKSNNHNSPDDENDEDESHEDDNNNDIVENDVGDDEDDNDDDEDISENDEDDAANDSGPSSKRLDD